MAAKKNAPVKATKPGIDPDVPVVINGDTYFLNFDFNAIARLEAEQGINMLLTVNFTSPVGIRGALWAACLKRHPDMTIDEAGALINLNTYADIMPALMEVWNISKPATEKDAKGNE